MESVDFEKTAPRACEQALRQESVELEEETVTHSGELGRLLAELNRGLTELDRVLTTARNKERELEEDEDRQCAGGDCNVCGAPCQCIDGAETCWPSCECYDMCMMCQDARHEHDNDRCIGVFGKSADVVDVQAAYASY